MKYKRNVGGIDRVLRFGIGSGLVYTGFFSTVLGDDSISAIVVGCLGTIFVLTAIFSNCPFYALIGFSTSTDRCENPNHK